MLPDPPTFEGLTQLSAALARDADYAPAFRHPAARPWLNQPSIVPAQDKS